MKTKMSLLAVAIAMVMVSCGSSKKSQNDQMMQMMMQMMMQQQQQNQGQSQQNYVNQTSQQPKVLVSETEEKIQEWKAQGYQLTGAYSTFTMKSVLENHNQKAMDTDKYEPLQGNGMGSEVSDSRMFAMNDAAIQYAVAAGSTIEGGITRQFGSMSEIGNKIVGAFVQKVPEFMIPHMKESFCLYRKNGNKIEVIAYYLIDQTKAYQARKNAMDAVLKEVQAEDAIARSTIDLARELAGKNPTKEEQ